MKYLITREQFLSKNTGSTLINEVLDAPITWGGSLIGRMVNSAIRRVKIGYNESQIDQVIVDLRNELDYLLSASLTGDAEKKFHELVVKKHLEDIKNVSLSTEEDDDKLEKLIGASTGLWDPTDPKKLQQSISGIVADAIDSIEGYTGLDKIMEMDRSKLLDLLSDFADELRKLTNKDSAGNLKDSGGNLSTTNYNLKTTINVLDTLKNLITTRNLDVKERKEYKLFGYLKFIESLESENNDSKEKDTAEKTTEKPVENKQQQNQQDQNNADNKEKTTEKTTKKPVENTDDKKQQQNQNNIDKGADTNKQDDKEDILKRIENLKNSVASHKSEESLKKDQDLKNRLTELSKYIKSNNLSNISIKVGGVSMGIDDYLDSFLKSLNSTNESLLILEFDGVKDIPKEVKQVWKNFFGQLDSKKPHRLTDREVEELDEFITDPKKISAAFVFNPSLRPDPIISISRVLTNAYNLFATDRIPSGRPEGRVSQKTLREYIKLGQKSNITVGDEGVKPGYGPWAVKSTFDKFKNGVLKLLQNQEYRKILANMKFVVPGSEDKFNESFILENENKSVSSGKGSHGQILLKLLNDVITPSKLGDFEELINTYTSEYFGVKISEKDKNEYKPAPTGKAASEDDLTNKLFWDKDNFSDSDIKSNNNKFNLFAYPCSPLDMDNSSWSGYKSQIGNILSPIDSNSGKNKILFLNRVLGVEKIEVRGVKFYPIKLTFNKQYLADKIKEEGGYEDITNWNVGQEKSNIHYGYISFDGDQIFLIHASVTTDGSPKSKVETIYYQILKSDKISFGAKDLEKSILWDGKKAKAYESQDDFTKRGENTNSKENYNIKFKDTGKKIGEVMEEEIKRIFK